MTALANAFAEPLVAAFALVDQPTPADPAQVVRELDALKALLREVRHVERRAEQRHRDAYLHAEEALKPTVPMTRAQALARHRGRAATLARALDAAYARSPADPAEREAMFVLMKCAIRRLWEQIRLREAAVSDALMTRLDCAFPSTRAR
ncbi:MAG: hypothetical protein AB7P21_07665 [Lautropia sp.]